MAAVDRNLTDMPVPNFAYTDRNDGRVFVRPVDPDGKVRKKTIGYMTVSTPGEERMIPNQYFREKYRDLFTQAYPDQKLPRHEMSVGIYALTLGITNQIGLYEDLREVYGPLYANSILDYSMFSLLYRSGVTQIFELVMDKEVLFCDKVHSDNWYSDFFSKKISEDNHHQFRIKWLQRLKKNGLSSVWIAIDGSNNDCEARSSFLAQHGFAKSHNLNKTIVGYMYAVDARTGQPVTYFVYEGNVPDSRAFQKISLFLGTCGIRIEGVILDRGFAVEPVFKAIEEYSWKYVVMLPSDTYGHVQMMKSYSETIRWKSEYIIENDALFGIADTQKLFGQHERKSCICLYFDGAGGSLKSVRLIRKIQTELRRLQKALAEGLKCTIDKKLQRYLTIEGEGTERKIVVSYDNWDSDMAGNGYFSLAVSEGITPSEANRLYKMRDTSEIQYAILKSQEGCHTTRVHSTEGIYSKFAVAFISGLVRHEIETACKRLELDTNPMIQSMEQVVLLYTSENRYEAVRNLSSDVKSLFYQFGIKQDDLERVAAEFNSRNRTDSKNPVRTIPGREHQVLQSNSHKRGRKPKVEQKPENLQVENNEPKEKNKGGRPKGKKDSVPRKSRSDKGKARGHYNMNKN